MTQKLFFVTVTYYAAADSASDCQYVDPDLTASNVDAQEVEPTDIIDSDWKDSLPFGSDEDRTCGNWFGEEEEEEEEINNEALPDPLFPELFENDPTNSL